MKLKFIPACAALPLLVAMSFVSSAQSTDEQDSTLTKAGQTAPDFVVKTLDGKEFKLSAQRGKPVLVNFFATWCGPCLAELPHVQKRIWEKFKDKGLVVIAIGREHENTELLKFQKEKEFTFPIAGDPKREVYSKYATMFIPRTYLINKDGKIVYQSMGFEEKEFESLLTAVEKECSRAK